MSKKGKVYDGKPGVASLGKASSAESNIFSDGEKRKAEKRAGTTKQEQENGLFCRFGEKQRTLIFRHQLPIIIIIVVLMLERGTREREQQTVAAKERKSSQEFTDCVMRRTGSLVPRSMGGSHRQKRKHSIIRLSLVAAITSSSSQRQSHYGSCVRATATTS